MIQTNDFQQIIAKRLPERYVFLKYHLFFSLTFLTVRAASHASCCTPMTVPALPAG